MTVGKDYEDAYFALKTYEKVGEKFGVSKQAVWEGIKRNNPNFVNLRKPGQYQGKPCQVCKRKMDGGHVRHESHGNCARCMLRIRRRIQKQKGSPIGEAGST
ncbi:MAG: hypothetical protein NUV65_03040 [Candidatus Roizmanbacteria bacterium]|nr:hypothetical protein [Candidatus Roizmanbacteria bacterium]